MTVTHVLFTHAHPDHLWGLLDEFDEPLFANAEYMIGAAEFDYWMNPDTVTTIGEARTTFAVGAQRRLAVIADTVRKVADGEEVLPGIAARLTAGHTPGHIAWDIAAGSDRVMVLGDAIGNHHVAFERPDWASGSDQDASHFLTGWQPTGTRSSASICPKAASAGWNGQGPATGSSKRSDSQRNDHPRSWEKQDDTTWICSACLVLRLWHRAGAGGDDLSLRRLV
jgi:hypothetical protein